MAHTSKTLFLTRHAKSSWAEPGLTDKQRPLNKRGMNDAPVMGKFLTGLDETPELIISSPALRARTTAKLIAAELGIAEDAIILDDDIYMAYPQDLMEIIHRLDNKFEKVMLVGHNPTMTELVNYLSGSNIDNVPTCGVALISFKVGDWGKVTKKTGVLQQFLFPKMLSNSS